MTVESRARRASIYCRVSTAEQVAGTSLDSQRAVCERYCEAREWTIHEVFVDDGVSGASRSRPGLDELLRSIRRNESDVVVVAKLDRLGRTMRGLVEWMSDWDDHGVTLVSVCESFDSSSSAARMQRHLLAMFAEFERDRIAERTMEGRDATVATGGWPGGPPPFGWRLARTKSDRFRRLEIDEQEAETIRRAVHLFITEGKGSTDIFRGFRSMPMSLRKRPPLLGTPRVVAQDARGARRRPASPPRPNRLACPSRRLVATPRNRQTPREVACVDPGNVGPSARSLGGKLVGGDPKPRTQIATTLRWTLQPGTVRR